MAYAPVVGQAKVTGVSYDGAFTGNPATGNLLVLCGAFDATATPSVLLKAGSTVGLGTITLLKSQVMKSNTEIGAVWVVPVLSGGTCTMTFSCAGSSFCDNVIHEFSLAVGGPVPALPGDQVASANWVASPASSGTTPSTSQANEMIFGYCVDARGQAVAADAGNGFTQLVNSNPNFTSMTQYKTVTSIGTYTQAGVVTGSPTDGASILVTIMEASPGTIITPGAGSLGYTLLSPNMLLGMGNTARIIISKA